MHVLARGRCRMYGGTAHHRHPHRTWQHVVHQVPAANNHNVQQSECSSHGGGGGGGGCQAMYSTARHCLTTEVVVP